MDGSYRWCITHNGYFDYHLGPTYMSEAVYNNKVAEAALAYLHKIITYDEWYNFMTKLIKERENEIFKTK
mgnify:CR=1 FL=1